MATVRSIQSARRLPSGRARARPAVRLVLETGDPAVDAPLGVVSLRLCVTGARAPVRLYLYVNGKLAGAWAEPQAQFEISVDEHGPGRHMVTARAVDALGRRAGATMVVACLEVEPASNE